MVIRSVRLGHFRTIDVLLGNKSDYVDVIPENRNGSCVDVILRNGIESCISMILGNGPVIDVIPLIIISPFSVILIPSLAPISCL